MARLWTPFLSSDMVAKALRVVMRLEDAATRGAKAAAAVVLVRGLKVVVVGLMLRADTVSRARGRIVRADMYTTWEGRRSGGEERDI